MGRNRWMRSKGQGWALLALVSVLALGPGGARAQSSANAGLLAAQDRAAIQRILDDMVVAWNADDLEGHISAYADEATYTTGKGVLRGRAAILGNLSGFKTPEGLYGELRFEDIAMRALGSNNALVTGRFVLTALGKDDLSGRFTLVWAHLSGGWRVVHDHSS